jgi:Ca-activated chloride channel family protein
MSGGLAALHAAASALGVDVLERPVLAAAGLVLAAAAGLLAARRRPPALPWPAWPEALRAGARVRDRGRAAGLVARVGALALLAVALAGPAGVHPVPPPPGEGLDILLVLDTSDSMRALDAQVDGVWRTRLDLARQVVARFARERAAAGDRVGLVVFGETAFTACPLTSDGRLLAAALARVSAGMAGGATALGDGLALAVKRVLASDGPAPVGEGAHGPAPGRIVVLLTDGRSNAGAVPPDVATALAAARGVRVHTVGIGSTGEVAVEDEDGAAGRGLHFERHDLDAATLRAIAAETGGRYFEAHGSGDLAAVYSAIDSLERVVRRRPPRMRRAPHPEPWLAAAGALVALEVLFGRGLTRRLP